MCFLSSLCDTARQLTPRDPDPLPTVALIPFPPSRLCPVCLQLRSQKSRDLAGEEKAKPRYDLTESLPIPAELSVSTTSALPAIQMAFSALGAVIFFHTYLPLTPFDLAATLSLSEAVRDAGPAQHGQARGVWVRGVPLRRARVPVHA